MRLGSIKSLSRSRRRQGLALAVVTMLLTSVIVVSTLTATDLNPAAPGDEQVSLAVNTFVDDTSVTITRLGFLKTTVTVGTLGDTPGGSVEALVDPWGVIRTALTADNWSYRIRIEEASVAAWGATDAFRLEVYGTKGASVADLLGDLYFDNSVIDAGTVEGVIATLDLGSLTEVYDDYSILVSRQ